MTLFLALCLSVCINIFCGETKKVWLDLDMGTDADDALALLLLLSMYEEGIEVIGLSTVATNPRFAARLSQKYISYFGFTGIIPVYYGLWNTTLENWNDTTSYNDYTFDNGVMSSEYPYWDQYIKSFPPPSDLFNSADIVYTVGPLTTIAHLFLMSNDYKIKQLIQMGGSILPEPIPSLDKSEILWDYNLRIDPNASWIVLTSDNVENIAFVTGNVTLECWMDLEDLQSMIDVESRYGAFQIIINEIQEWHQDSVDTGRFDGVGINMTADIVEFLHDPLTVSYGFEDLVDGGAKWLTMEQSDIAFWINDNRLFQTIKVSENQSQFPSDVFIKQNVMWSKENDCGAFLDFYFSKVNNFVYTNNTNNCISSDPMDEGNINIWMIIGIVFICLFMVALIVVIALVYTLRKRQQKGYNRAHGDPPQEMTGFKTTQQNY